MWPFYRRKLLLVATSTFLCLWLSLFNFVNLYVTSEPGLLTNLIKKLTGDKLNETRALFFRYGLQPNDPVEVGYTNWSCTHPDLTTLTEDALIILYERWCNGTEADRESVNLELKKIAKRRRRLEILMADMTYLLSDEDDTKRKFCMEEHFVVPNMVHTLDCVTNITDTFWKTCFKPNTSNPYWDRMSHIFIRACDADWLTSDRVYAITKLVCADQEKLDDVL